MIVVLTGTPGTGKSSVASELSKTLGYQVVSVSKLAIEKGLYTEFDEETQSYIVDEEALKREITSLAKSKDVIIETIYPSLVECADLVIVLRRNPLRLLEELKARGWPLRKVMENVEAELLGIVEAEARESFSNVCTIDTTSKTPSDVVRTVLAGQCDDVDWLSVEESTRVIELLQSMDYNADDSLR
jgi:adenylate kinase